MVKSDNVTESIQYTMGQFGFTRACPVIQLVSDRTTKVVKRQNKTKYHKHKSQQQYTHS